MCYRLVRAVVLATLGALALVCQAPTLAQSEALACAAADLRTDMRLLVISADGKEADLPAIRAALDYIGTPYEVYIATNNPGALTRGRWPADVTHSIRV